MMEIGSDIGKSSVPGGKEIQEAAALLGVSKTTFLKWAKESLADEGT